MSYMMCALFYAGPSGASRVKTIKSDATELGECKTFKAAGYVVPKNPYFVSVVSQYSRYVMVSLGALSTFQGFSSFFIKEYVTKSSLHFLLFKDYWVISHGYIVQFLATL